MRKIFSSLLFLLILALGIHYFESHKGFFSLITTLSAHYVLMLSLLTILLSLSYGLQVKILTDHFQLNLTFFRCFGLSRATSFVNLWLPAGGGASFKAVYLKKLHDLNYSSFIASSGIAIAINFLLNSFFALVLLGMSGRDADMHLLVMSGVIFIAVLLVLFLGHSVMSRFGGLLGYFKNIIAEWDAMRKDRRTLKKLFGTSGVIFMLATLRVYVSFHAFSADISIVTCGTMAAFATMTGILNLVPANYGIREAIIISFSGISGIDINIGVHAAAFDRISSVLWTMVLTLFFRYGKAEKKADTIS